MSEKGLHIGLILDGNRRWAKARNKHPWEGHRAGAEALQKLLTSDSLKDLGVKELTLYTFSMQNFKRAEEEKSQLFNLLKEYFKKFLIDPKIMENGVKIRVIGRTHLLPKDVQQVIEEMEDKTFNNKEFQVNFAMAYGGREELIDAIRLMVAKKVKADDIDEQTVNNHLYLSKNPDFIIRTSGEFRTSNFLIWQASYSEWFFLDKNWPDFTIDDLKSCINQFNTRNRRFGN